MVKTNKNMIILLIIIGMIIMVSGEKKQFLNSASLTNLVSEHCPNFPGADIYRCAPPGENVVYCLDSPKGTCETFWTNIDRWQYCSFTQNCEVGQQCTNGEWRCVVSQDFVWECINGQWESFGNCPSQKQCTSIIGDSFDDVCFIDSETQCSDGTAIGACSSTQPRECIQPNINNAPFLVNSCGRCGCPTNEDCNTQTDECVDEVTNTCQLGSVQTDKGETICSTNGDAVLRCSDELINVLEFSCSGVTSCTPFEVNPTSCCNPLCSNGCNTDGSCKTSSENGPCSADVDCPVNNICDAGTCTEVECASDSACPTDTACKDYFCNNQVFCDWNPQNNNGACTTSSNAAGMCSLGECIQTTVVENSCASLGGTIQSQSCTDLDLTQVFGATDLTDSQSCCKAKTEESECLSFIETFEDGECKLNPILLYIGGFIALAVILSTFKRGKK